jgi:predicted alpha/beta hydrolase family esterase
MYPDVLKFCCGYNVNPISFAGKIDEPTIIIASKADKRISYNHSMNVARKIENCKVDTFNTYGHDNMLNLETFGLVNDFLDNTTLTE